jgi:methionyl-tRNA formyltransferase
VKGERHLVAGSRPWCRSVFDEVLCRLPGEWRYVGDRADLTPEAVDRIAPRDLFFLHWSWTVAPEIVDRHECILFHMTDVPYGRGGSPLQNLILRGHRATRLSALRMTAELDAGPVYLKEDLDLTGSAADIYRRAMVVAAGMIERIVRERPAPVPQQGTPVLFERRRPRQSELPPLDTVERLHDFIRMLDADGYPRAFFRHQGFRYTLAGAALEGGTLTAQVTVQREDEER